MATFLIDEDCFLGAKSGIVGLLYILMKAVQASYTLKQDKSLLKAIENTLNQVCKIVEKANILSDYLKGLSFEV